jgi:hypothetical protein
MIDLECAPLGVDEENELVVRLQPRLEDRLQVV